MALRCKIELELYSKTNWKLKYSMIFYNFAIHKKAVLQIFNLSFMAFCMGPALIKKTGSNVNMFSRKKFNKIIWKCNSKLQNHQKGRESESQWDLPVALWKLEFFSYNRKQPSIFSDSCNISGDILIKDVHKVLGKLFLPGAMAHALVCHIYLSKKDICLQSSLQSFC